MSLLQQIRVARLRRRCNLPLQLRLLEQPLPPRSARIADLEMIALDFETTGLDAQQDHIIAAGWVLIRGDSLVMASAREVRVRNGSPDGVGQSAVIHGILDSDLDDADSVGAMVEHLLPELAGRAVVAHAATIERSFLAALLRRMGGVPMPNPFIDTMALERHLIEGFRQVIVGLIQRVFRMTGEGQVQLAIGNGLREVEQVPTNAIGINRAR